MYQDNNSALLLYVTGKRSTGKRTQAMNIGYFFMTDQVEKENAYIGYFPTDEMWRYFMTNNARFKV